MGVENGMLWFLYVFLIKGLDVGKAAFYGVRGNGMWGKLINFLVLYFFKNCIMED